MAATEKNDIESLENAVIKFEEAGLPDNGDLEKAKAKLVSLHEQGMFRCLKRDVLDFYLS